MTSGDILFERRGVAGLVTLNRPHALNAVSLAMVRELTRQLAEWEREPRVSQNANSPNSADASARLACMAKPRA